MRKKAQEKKRVVSASTISSKCSSSSSNNHTGDSFPSLETGEESFYDTGGPNMVVSAKKIGKQQEGEQVYSMDDIWKDIALSEDNILKPVYKGHSVEGCIFSCPPMASPSWEYTSDSLWMMDEEEHKMFLPINDHFFPATNMGWHP